MGGEVALPGSGGELCVAESAKHFARVPGPWPGTTPYDHGLPLEKQPAVGRQRS